MREAVRVVAGAYGRRACVITVGGVETCNGEGAARWRSVYGGVYAGTDGGEEGIIGVVVKDVLVPAAGALGVVVDGFDRDTASV